MARENIPELNTIWDEARNHIESGRQDKAIEIYKYVLLRYGSDPTAAEYANAYLADIYLGLSEFDLAEDHIKKAIGLKPENGGYHYILGFVFTYRKQWEKAIAEFKVAVSREPDNDEFVRGLGWATFQNGSRIRGLNLLREANCLDPRNVNILNDLAVAYMGTNLRRARQYAEQAASIEPGNPVAKDILRQIGVFEEAAADILAGTNLRPPNFNERPGLTLIFQFRVSVKDDPGKWRIIEIKHNQLFSTLHRGIASAFGYDEAHSFSFFFNRNNKQNEFAAAPPGISGTAKLAKSIRVDSIFLFKDEGQKFHYLYDYEKKILHEVDLVRVIEKVPRGAYPRVIKRHG